MTGAALGGRQRGARDEGGWRVRYTYRLALGDTLRAFAATRVGRVVAGVVLAMLPVAALAGVAGATTTPPATTTLSTNVTSIGAKLLADFGIVFGGATVLFALVIAARAAWKWFSVAVLHR